MAPQDPDGTMAFLVEGDRYEIAFDDLEFGEIELLEEAFDLPVDQISFKRAKAIRILVFIVMRRKDPAVTMDRVAHVKFSQFEPVEDEKPARPTKKGAKASA